MCRQLTAVTPAHLCIRPATPPRGTCTPPSGHAETRSTNTRSISPASPTSTGKPPQAGPNRRLPNTGNHKKGWLLRRMRGQREPPRRGGRDYQCRWWLWCILIFFLFLQRFKYIYRTADLFTHRWRQRQRRQQSKKLIQNTQTVETCSETMRRVQCCCQAVPLLWGMYTSARVRLESAHTSSRRPSLWLQIRGLLAAGDTLQLQRHRGFL